MSIAQSLLGGVPDDVDDPLVDFAADEPDELDVEGVLAGAAVFLASLPEPLSVDVDVPPEPESELDDSVFEAVPDFDEARLSVL
jgi:hypothetical protein